MTTKRGVGAVVLAAGGARRFGADKLLAPLPDGTPLGLAAVRAVAPHVDALRVVVAPGQVARAALFSAQGCTVIACDEAARGLGHSIACGVRALPQCAGWLIVLADMPWLRGDTVAVLLREFAAHPEDIVRPRYAGRPGHPVVFPVGARAELLALTGDQGARAVVERNAARVRYCGVDDNGVAADVDVPDDLPVAHR